MGMGASGSHLIFFIGALMIASIVVSVMIGGIESISSGRREKTDRTQKEMECRMDIINDPRRVNNTPVLIYVKNTGLKKIDPNEVAIFLDGEMITNFTREFVDDNAFFDDDIWSRAEVLLYTINTTLEEGRHGAKAVLFGRVLSRIYFEITD